MKLENLKIKLLELIRSMKQVNTYLVFRNFNSTFSGEITTIDANGKQSNLTNILLELKKHLKQDQKKISIKKEIFIKV